MKANSKFKNLKKSFWADVRLISETVGYTVRNKNIVKVPDLKDIILSYKNKKLDINHIIINNKITNYGELLLDYFNYRAEILNLKVEKYLMNADEAKILFENLYSEIKPPDKLIPVNKQKGDKKKPAYLTSIVNMIIYKILKSDSFDYDPRNLTLITKKNIPLRTLARRIDGAYPSAKDPKAIWEIKEYYYTTTFGSRVADGIYESILDGLELEDLLEHEKIKVLHYLMVDAKYTWWDCGKSYLCRLIDMLNMEYVDEILFGKEVITELPNIVKYWIS